MRGRAMSRQASAEPTTGPTRPARSRTTSVLSPAAALAALASNAPNTTIQRRVIAGSARPRSNWASSFSLWFVDCVTKVLWLARAAAAIAQIAEAAFRTLRASQAVRQGVTPGSSETRQERVSTHRLFDSAGTDRALTTVITRRRDY